MSSYAGVGESDNFSGTGVSDDFFDPNNHQTRKRNSNRYQYQFGALIATIAGSFSGGSH